MSAVADRGLCSSSPDTPRTPGEVVDGLCLSALESHVGGQADWVSSQNLSLRADEGAAVKAGLSEPCASIPARDSEPCTDSDGEGAVHKSSAGTELCIAESVGAVIIDPVALCEKMNGQI